MRNIHSESLMCFADINNIIKKIAQKFYASASWNLFHVHIGSTFPNSTSSLAQPRSIRPPFASK